MPGKYPPPAVELPNTTEIVGMRILERRAISRNPRPPGTKILLCTGRSAPADSTNIIVVRRFSRAISASRAFFQRPASPVEPPLAVASLATIMHSRPETKASDDACPGDLVIEADASQRRAFE